MGRRALIWVGALCALLAIAQAVRTKHSGAKDSRSEGKIVSWPGPKDYEALRDAIKAIAGDDKDSYGPIFIRLAWHSSGSYSKLDRTGGSNGARMRFSPEKDWAANRGLEIARGELDKIKDQFPWVTYADLYTLAGAVAVEAMGGPHIPWRPGRSDATDGATSPPDGRLPDASKNASHVRDVFSRLGFNDRDTVALIGAHVVGSCHRDRSGYDGPWTPNPTTFSNDFFLALVNEAWVPRKWDGPMQYQPADGGDTMMLPSDMALTFDRRYVRYVKEFAGDQKAFFNAFARAFSKLIELGVKFPRRDEEIWL